MNSIRIGLFTVLLLCSHLLSFSQDTNHIHKMIYTYYSDLALKIVFCIPSNSIEFQKTNTIEGFEVDYYYFEDSDWRKCNELVFFTTDSSILKAKNIYSFFQHKAMYFVNYNYLDFLSASKHTERDTFNYDFNVNTYEENNFLKYKEKEDDKHFFYKVSKSEYLKIARVKVVSDYFIGSDSLYTYFLPTLTYAPIGGKDMVLQIHYRNVLSKEYIYPAKFFNTKKEYVKEMNGCVYSEE